MYRLYQCELNVELKKNVAFTELNVHSSEMADIISFREKQILICPTFFLLAV